MTPTESRRAKALEYALEFYRGRVVPHSTIIGAAAVFDDFLGTGAGADMDITISVGDVAGDIRKAMLKHARRTGRGLS